MQRTHKATGSQPHAGCAFFRCRQAPSPPLLSLVAVHMAALSSDCINDLAHALARLAHLSVWLCVCISSLCVCTVCALRHPGAQLCLSLPSKSATVCMTAHWVAAAFTAMRFRQPLTSTTMSSTSLSHRCMLKPTTHPGQTHTACPLPASPAPPARSCPPPAAG